LQNEKKAQVLAVLMSVEGVPVWWCAKDTEALSIWPLGGGEKKWWSEMRTVFDGLMGNTSNLRVISFLLPLTHAKFTEKDLIEEVGVSKPTMIKVIRKLVEYELITQVEKRGNSTYYRVNTASPFIKAFEDLDNLIIEHKYGDLTAEEGMGEAAPHKGVSDVADPPIPY
jgi:hypothetical protein